jgi:hypothetical protein
VLGVYEAVKDALVAAMLEAARLMGGGVGGWPVKCLVACVGTGRAGSTPPHPRRWDGLITAFLTHSIPTMHMHYRPTLQVLDESTDGHAERKEDPTASYPGGL